MRSVQAQAHDNTQHVAAACHTVVAKELRDDAAACILQYGTKAKVSKSACCGLCAIRSSCSWGSRSQLLALGSSPAQPCPNAASVGAAAAVSL